MLVRYLRSQYERNALVSGAPIEPPWTQGGIVLSQSRGVVALVVEGDACLHQLIRRSLETLAVENGRDLHGTIMPGNSRLTNLLFLLIPLGKTGP